MNPSEPLLRAATGAVLYAFEEIDETLPYVPLAARRVLDVLGRKLSLEGWLSLPLQERRGIARAGAREHVDFDVAEEIERAVPLPARVHPVLEPDASAAPRQLLDALGRGRPLDDPLWASLRALDRYALVKCASKPEKLARAYDEIVLRTPLAHLTSRGEAHMVDVGDKAPTPRRAVATARVRTTPDVVERVASGGIAKGDVAAAARIAGILAAKRTPDLVPLCHPVHTTHATIDVEPDAARGELRVRATVAAIDRTGVEMEAMVAASVAALTVYDMIKSADRWATIEMLRLEEKSGGKSGHVKRSEPT